MADNEMEAPAVQVLPNTTEPVDFSAAQQVVFDAALKKAMGRAGADARAEAERLRIENERLKAQAIGAAPDSSEVEKLRAQVADSQLQAADAERRGRCARVGSPRRGGHHHGLSQPGPRAHARAG